MEETGILKSFELPRRWYVGTSTWAYEDWQGLLYHQEYPNQKAFNLESLKEYADVPWLKTVGIDSGLYHPLDTETLLSYNARTPSHFRWVPKVWERLTIPQYPAAKRYGALAGTVNEHFLDPEFFKEKVLAPYLADEEVQEKTGAFLLQFPRMNEDASRVFGKKLRSFIERVSSPIPFVVEVRNKEFITPKYFTFLNELEVSHCFTHWTVMPSLREQMQCAAKAGGLKGNLLFCRLTTPRGVGYSEAEERFKPYNTIKFVDEEMRRDVVTFLKRAFEREEPMYLIASNNVEGCSLLTLEGILRAFFNT